MPLVPPSPPTAAPRDAGPAGYSAADYSCAINASIRLLSMPPMFMSVLPVPVKQIDSGCQNISARATIAFEQHGKQGLIPGFECCRTAP
jgi:hypothetical protein